jgi:flagellin
MPQIINTNIASLNAQRNLNASQSAMQTALQRLSSGLRINSAKDDAAGLAISERMTSQINGLDQSVRNANDAISLAQTAEGSLASIGDMLQRVRQLAVQSVNDTNTTSDRAALDTEAQKLFNEISRVAASAQFNGQNLLTGSFSNKSFQVGANVGQTISMTIKTASLTALSITGLALTTATNANTALSQVSKALNTINTQRAELGAYQSRFTSVISNLQTSSENLSAARSRIRDTDFAAETSAMTRGQILQQAGVAMLAQANALPNNVMTLLR